jgi:Protein of unknown function (DUF2752)
MTPRQEFARTLGWPTRRALVLAALGLVGVLGVARQLEPDPRGFGTHTQLGLAPCAFALVTGHPCPTCGMTTSFAWFARGRFDHSWRANPAGSLLAPTCVALVPWLLAGAARGRPPGFRSLDRPLIGLVVATVALSLVSWTLRLILGRA